MKSLFEHSVDVVDRAAKCFAAEDPTIDAPFWETLYGPYGDAQQDIGMLPWTDFSDYEDA
jgi:hypothetical protein